MKSTTIFAVALASFLSLSNVAAADPVSDRNHAIQLCRAEVSAQAGEGAEVRLDQVRVHPHLVRVDLDLWRSGQLQNVRCDVTRGANGEVAVASITPALQTASLAN